MAVARVLDTHGAQADHAVEKHQQHHADDHGDDRGHRVAEQLPALRAAELAPTGPRWSWPRARQAIGDRARPAAGHDGGVTAALDELLDLLDLEALEVDLYRGFSPPEHRLRVFGGQVAAQALVAAGRTVADGAGARAPGALPARLLPPPGRPEDPDPLPGGPHPRREVFYHPASGRHPAGRGDLPPVGVVSRSRGGREPPATGTRRPRPGNAADLDAS